MLGYDDAVGVPFLLVAVTAFRVHSGARLRPSRSLATSCALLVDARDGFYAAVTWARASPSCERAPPYAWTVPGP